MTTRTLDDLLSDGYLDSRDLEERLAELENLAADFVGMDEDAGGMTEDEKEELKELRTICEEGNGSFEDWTHGTSLVPENDWVEYAQQLADDVGAVDSDAGWPMSYIDWEAAAAALQMDYTSIEIRGTTYWGR